MIQFPALYFAHGFVRAAHHAQRRKYTNTPYAEHCLAVSQLVSEHILDLEVAIAALLHDVIEDTPITSEELREIFGDRVTDLVLEVTDVSKTEDGNRAVRKAIDREHLAKSSPDGATIKLADIIDNTSSIVQHDPQFARKYLAEKELVLPLLKHGNAALWDRAASVIQKGNERLNSLG